jgi:EmrB/QacA subfamily drug resistance transporter
MSARPGRALALLVAATFFMENLDGTIVANAAPRIAAAFGTAAVDVNVVMTAYLITLAVGIPVSGWFAERWGARAVYCSAIAVFTVASGVCAISVSLPMLTVTRVLQGLGGAMMVPVGRLVVLRVTERRDLVVAIAYLTWPGLLAPVLAPALGGLFVTYASWRWIFLVNLPLGAACLAAALRMVPSGERTAGRPRFDWPGFALTGAGLAAVVLAMERFGGGAVSGPSAVLAAGVGLLALAVLHLRRTPRPLVDLRTLRIPTFRATTFGGMGFRTMVSAAPFLLPLMFQDAFGWSPLRAGLMVIAVFAGNVGIKPFTTPLMRRFGFRPVLLVSIAGLSVTFVGCALVSGSTPLWLTLPVLLASGIFRSTGFTAYNTLQFADVGPEDLPAANTLAATGQQLAAGLGVAVGALILRLSGPAASALWGDGRDGAYRLAFLVLAVFSGVSSVEAARLDPEAGAAVRPTAA